MYEECCSKCLSFPIEQKIDYLPIDNNRKTKKKEWKFLMSINSSKSENV